jgi:hypothetical protein
VDKYVVLEEAVRLSGLYPDTLTRLLRSGVLRGEKRTHNHRQRWFVSVQSLAAYLNEENLFMSARTGPKMYLRRITDNWK